MTSPKHNSKRRQLLMASAALSALPLPILSAQESSPYGIEGKMAPEITLNYWIDAKGNPGNFSIEANRGKWIFIKCFQSWCPGCHSSGFPSLQAFSKEFHNHPEVAIVAIQTVFEGFSTNTQDRVRYWQQQYQLPITMGHDPGNELTDESPQVMKNYRTGGTPWMILIAPDSRVAFNSFHVRTDKLIEFIKQQVG